MARLHEFVSFQFLVFIMIDDGLALFVSLIRKSFHLAEISFDLLCFKIEIPCKINIVVFPNVQMTPFVSTSHF